METNFATRIKHAWNAFLNRDPTSSPASTYSRGWASTRPDRPLLMGKHANKIITPIYNRIALDVASNEFRHVKLDADGRYLEDVDSSLNEIFKTEANIDQTPRAFIQDLILSMFDEGCVAVVPVDTEDSLKSGFNILTVRVGKIVAWYSDSVRVLVYNEKTLLKEEVTLPKKMVAIIENPFYMIMNEPNSTLQRLIRKLNLLDVVDEQSSSGKMDLIIQVPYGIRTNSRKELAEERRSAIEQQLTGSKYGIAYIDATEHITQLNRPVENNLMNQVEYLTSMLFSQLGMTQGILDGTADEETILNYSNRIIEPCTSAMADELKRKFLTKKARKEKESIMVFRDPFRFVPITKIADMADKFTRNEVLSSNEVRQGMGIKPSKDPKADELRNKNISQSKQAIEPLPKLDNEGGKNQNE